VLSVSKQFFMPGSIQRNQENDRMQAAVTQGRIENFCVIREQKFFKAGRHTTKFISRKKASFV
jgi:hypothetical protein